MRQMSSKLVNPLRKYRDFFIFKDGGRLPTCILKVCFPYSAGKANMHQQNKFAIFFDFHGRHFGFVWGIFGLPMKGTLWSLSSCKI